MRKFIQQKLKEQKGLTLIELLAVIVILAIIAAIAIPAIGNIINNSRVGAIKSDAQNALAAAELYLIDVPNHFTTNPLVTDIVMADLNPGYLDDPGSFATVTDFKITKADSGQLLLTATDASIGSVKLTFTGANKTAINSLKNNTTDDDTADANKTVVGDDTNGILGSVAVTER
jgi:type IV pilus assembly protein PilA